MPATRPCSSPDPPMLDLPPLSHHTAVPAVFIAVFPTFWEAAEWASVVSLPSAPLPGAAAAGEPLQNYLVPRAVGCSILSVAQRVCLSAVWTFASRVFQWLIIWSSQVDFCMYGKRCYNWRGLALLFLKLLPDIPLRIVFFPKINWKSEQNYAMHNTKIDPGWNLCNCSFIKWGEKSPQRY